MIIPAYNEETRLPKTLGQVFDFLSKQSYAFEVLVVENGSQDKTFEIAQSFAKEHHEMTVLQEPLPGKGSAVRKGMLAAKGEYRFMCDADLSMPIEEVNRFIPPQLNDFDLAIASREAPGAVRYDEPEYRHLGGRMVNLMIRMLALPGMHDSQCGFKCFRDTVAADLFSNQTLANFSFDIELLYLARHRGYRILELPIPWYFNADTKLNPVRDALQMALDIWTVRQNKRRGRYDSQG
ncbi:MAG: glycosyltransferase family 2 protein [Anaerolineales bacterium]|nr:glycosyltransferase family 2 protein [Chloroflexota bacterium]MBL6981032.1 glycosyltransferase family 2 protein [Anaerolineales bacterium]